MALLFKNLRLLNMAYCRSEIALIHNYNINFNLCKHTEKPVYHAFKRCMSSATAITNIGIEELQKFQNNSKATIIDVREVNEIQETGKLPGSVHIPLGEVTQALQEGNNLFKTKYNISKPSFTDTVVFSCRSGRRSMKAAEAATSLGYNSVYNYEGGWLDWEQHFPPKK